MSFKIYRSSAGSGKTFSLTKEYLKLALTSGDPSRAFSPSYYKTILAITFTKMAAGEMKERVLRQLSIFSKLTAEQKEPMLDIILEEVSHEYGEKAEGFTQEEVCHRAQLLHREILHRYTDFSLSTIDAFNNRIVQAFTQELDLPYNYEIDEDENEVVAEAIQLLFSEVQENDTEGLSKFLKKIVDNNIDDNRSWFFDKQLEGFTRQLQKEHVLPYLEKTKEITLEKWLTLEKQVAKMVYSFENTIVSCGTKGLQMIEEAGIEKGDLPNRDAAKSYFYKAKNLESDFLIGEKLTNAKKTFEDDNWYSTKTKKSAKKQAKIDAVKDQLTQLYYAIEEVRDDADRYAQYILAKGMHQEMLYVGLLKAIKERLDALKDERSKIFFSDLTFRINEVIENDPVPYIYERVGEKYNHILIDEFQDTSKMQWHNLLPLVLSGLAKNKFSLVVGDTKQSIYRFRGGQADLLANLPKVPSLPPASPLRIDVETLGSNTQEINLDTNRRSVEGIVSFNNDLYNFMVSQHKEEYPSLPIFYKDAAQKIFKKGKSEVSLHLIDTQKKGPHDLHKEEYEKATVQLLLNQIEKLKAEGYPLSDITILVRTNKNAATIGGYFLKENIPVISNESLLLRYADTVRFLIGFMRLMVVPVAPKEKMELITFLHRFRKKQHSSEATLSGEEILKVSKEIHDENPAKTIVYIERTFDFKLDLYQWSHLSLYNLAEKIAQVFNLWEAEEEVVYLQRTLDYIKQQMIVNGNQLKSFLNYWEKKQEKLALQIPEGEEAVKIMTLHKSKGLEFPIVLLPFADWEVSLEAQSHFKKELMWQDWQTTETELNFVAIKPKKELNATALHEAYRQEKEVFFMDALNMLYVATTRAQQQLHMIGRWSRTLKEPKRVNELLQQFALENYSNLLSDEQQTIEGNITSNYKYLTIIEGDTDPLKSVKPSEVQSVTLANQPYGSVANAISVARETASKHVPLVSDFNKAAKRGILLHFAFEKIRYRKDAPQVVAELAHLGMILPEEKEVILSEIEQVLNLPTIKPYFEHTEDIQIFNERSILGKQILRPDRVVITPNELIVIDYKTGHPQKAHKTQIAEYMEKLESIEQKPIKGFLVYTEILEVVGI